MTSGPRVVEYLGLPGVGKTSHLGSSGFCERSGAIASPVPQGKDAQKRSNTLRGIAQAPRLFALLVWASISNWKSLTLPTSVRPIFVVVERIGRVASLRRGDPGHEVHLDEGALQFIWRTFSQMEVTERNQRLMDRCVAAVPQPADVYVAYISCPSAQHVQQVISRGKGSPFDQAVIAGDDAQHQRGRSWMATLLLLLRRAGIPIRYVHTEPAR